ncbi:MAG: P1 family peptidase [Gammaproteobacteria bacterium]|nr:P1 family peptidase [Gammaproteobacteria bacterium]
MRNLPPGFTIGHATQTALNTGVTVILPEQFATAGVHVMGGAPGTRETDLLSPSQIVSTIDALTFSGGSAFGLDAASGVQAWLREHGRGYPVVPHRVPIVPAAIIFDLRTGRLKDWGRYPPYRELGFEACDKATDTPALGQIGAGRGASTVTGAGGFGLASMTLEGGITATAAVVCNAAGSTHVGNTPHFWAAPFETGSEFGGRGYPHPWPADARRVRTKAGFREMENTTLAAVLTDAVLTSAEAERIAMVAHDGFARAIYPVHTPADGDIVFTLANGRAGKPPADLMLFGVAAANVVARAIAVAVFSAEQQQKEQQEEQQEEQQGEQRNA